MRVRHLALIIAVSATMLAVVSGLGACSSSNGASGLPKQIPAAGSSSVAPTSAFRLATNKQYGFSVGYPASWLSASTSAKAGDTSGAPLTSVTWADPNGKMVAGYSVDALQVSVYAISKPVTPADLVNHAGDFKAIAYGLVKGLPSLSVTSPFKPITVNGTKGFQMIYRYETHNTAIGAMSYLLPKGRYAYWITGQASADTWSASWSKLTPAMASLTLVPVKAK